MVERKYILFVSRLSKKAVTGIIMPEINDAPLVSHWAKPADTPKYSVKFGIIFAVTVVDIAVTKVPTIRVRKIPFLFAAEISIISK